MEEFPVQKQGRFNYRSWSERVLSLHAPLGLAAITERKNPDDRLHECMRVGRVQIWPQYQQKLVDDSYQSTAAKLTIRVKGIPVKIGFRDETTKDGATERIFRFTRPGPGAQYVSWMLRFTSFEELEKAVRLLNSMKVGDGIADSVYSSSPTTADDIGGEVVEVRLEVEPSATAPMMIAGDVEEELREIREQLVKQSLKRTSNYNNL